MDDGKEKAAVAVGEAYISGALTALEDAPRTKVFYELLAEIAEAAGLRAYLPRRVTDPVAAAHLDPRSVYEIDRAHVTNAAVLIAYAGIPSFGVGIEVELAREHSVPVIVVAERERPISRLLLGNPAVVEVVKFADLDGLRRALGSSLAEAAATLGVDPRTVRRHVATARARVGLPEDAAADPVAQWLVTELIAPPTRALQLHLFTGGRAR